MTSRHPISRGDSSIRVVSKPDLMSGAIRFYKSSRFDSSDEANSSDEISLNRPLSEIGYVRENIQRRESDPRFQARSLAE
jgi:hypothetical protein